ncbi:MAG: PAS domain S-box protein [Desulfobaccales bacterium]
MNEPQKRIVSITTTLAMALALIIIAGIPLGYFLVKYYNLNEVLKARAETRAIFATQIISNNPDLWQFESIRLEHFLSQETDSGEPEEQRIIDLKGQIVAQTSRRLASPVHTISYPLYESGRVVGYLEISRSLRPLLDYSLFFGVLSLLLGAAVYLTLKSYPLRALSQTLTLLNKEQQRFQVIFQSSLMAVAVLDRDCTILDANPTFLNLTLMSKEELRDYNFLELELSEEREGMGRLFQELLEGQLESFHLEMSYQRRDGVLRWGDLSVFALHEATEENISFFAMFNDITRRKQAEEDLRQNENKYRALVETSFDWIWEVDAQSRYTFVSVKAIDILGYTPEEMLGRTPFDFMPEDEAVRIHEAFAAIVAVKQPFSALENVNVHRDGRLIVLESSGVPIFGPNGEFMGYRGTDRDITARKQSEAALQDSYLKMKQALNGVVQALSYTIELKDPYTAGHQQRVAQLACAISEALGWSPEHIERIRILGYLHDIGKIAVPAQILIKPGKLSEMEFEIVKTHPQKGYEILNKLSFGWPIAQAVHQHHERLDGSGYPQGLTGSDIIQEARILAVADVVEAMVSHRPHRPAMGIDQVLEEISKNKGILYDPEVVEACIKLFREQGFRFEAYGGAG